MRVRSIKSATSTRALAPSFRDKASLRRRSNFPPFFDVGTTLVSSNRICATDLAKACSAKDGIRPRLGSWSRTLIASCKFGAICETMLRYSSMPKVSFPRLALNRVYRLYRLRSVGVRLLSRLCSTRLASMTASNLFRKAGAVEFATTSL